ncbi:MAG: hypothetical protein IKU66_06955 [Clostridia bacterium]|nr:hypothetical protein [Clostridia bacterium]
MNNLFNSQVDSLKLAKAITEENNKTIRQLFKDKINGSFLIRIKSEVLNKIAPDLFNYYSINFDNAKIVTGRDETPEYDICRIIVGVHKHNSIFLTKEEIRKNEKDNNYQQKLVNKVIEKIKLRQYGSKFFRRNQLLLGDEFLYFPVPYELFVMCVKSITLISESSNPLFIHYKGIICNALSVLTLLENNLLSNAYPLCRGMIEAYLKTLIIQKHPEINDTYLKFCNFEIEQSCCSQEYPEEFEKLYANHRLPTKSKTNYLHYGWLDEISDYNDNYSIYGILNYLFDNTDNRKHQIERLYKMCHGYTHGSVTYVKYPLLQYFEISMMLYYVIIDIFNAIHNELKIEISAEDKCLCDMLERDFNVLKQQYKNRSTENFKTYYSI